MEHGNVARGKRRRLDEQINWSKINSAITATGFFPIEQLLGKRYLYEAKQYLVKWEGYDEPTWLNKENIKFGYVNYGTADSSPIVQFHRILVARAPNLLSKIPLELLSHIISFMNRKTYEICRLVSKSWMRAANKVRPEYDVKDLMERVYSFFGTSWFDKYLIGLHPKSSWKDYPFYPFDFQLAHKIMEAVGNSMYCIYPASWEGTELTSIGIVWQDREHTIRDLVLTSSNYFTDNAKAGLAGCQREKGNSSFVHWHQRHGTLSMENHLAYLPEGIKPLPIEMVKSVLAVVGRWKLRVFHTWKDIVEGKSPMIQGPLW